MENRPNAAALTSVKARILAEIAALQTNGDGVFDAAKQVDFGALGSRLAKAGVDWKSCGVSGNFTAFMEAAFRDEAERVELEFRLNKAGANPNSRVRLTRAPSFASPPSQLSVAEAEARVLAAIRELQTNENGERNAGVWVDFANLGSRLKQSGVDFKAFGHATFAKFLRARFAERLELEGEGTRWRVRPKTSNKAKTSTDGALSPPLPLNASTSAASGKFPNKDDAELADWAVVAPERFDELAALAFPEKWRFDDAEPTPEASRYPILESYLKYTFRQLAFEDKVKIAAAGDVAAFNTGLFDRKFDPIFAFFRKNVGPEPQPWRLSSFAVVAENADGKELVARFEPLPERARFFERREDLLFDGDAAIRCDGEHCLVENVARLPSEFLRRYCSPEFLTLEIDGETRTLDAVAARPEKDPERRRYFKALEKRLPGSSELFEMKLRFDAAVELAKKRVAANFRTAVPFFNPRKRNVCYFLPLTLTARREAPERADVALVVERFPETGVYQGHTVYTLDTAYKNARLTARLGGENWLDG